MSRHARVTAALAATLLMSFSIHAQEMRRSGSGNGLPPYKVESETTVAGEVTGSEISEMQAGPAFVVLSVTVSGKPLRVLLGPQGWLKEKGIVFTPGMKIEVTGVSNGMHYRGDAAMMARQIKAGAKTFAMRGADGTPEWEK